MIPTHRQGGRHTQPKIECAKSYNKHMFEVLWDPTVEINSTWVRIIFTEERASVLDFEGWIGVHFAKSLQSCPTLCDPIDGSPPGSPIPGILQARTLEWVAISFSNAGKWKVKGKLLSHIWPFATPWTRLLRPWDFPGKSTGVGCHCLLRRLS